MTCLQPQAGKLKSRTGFKSTYSKIESKIIIGFGESILTKRNYLLDRSFRGAFGQPC
jgi:hypothetical protein